MICETVRKGQDCPFMTAKGCSYTGGVCREIVEQCDGCSRTTQFDSGWYCTACPEPKKRWKNGNCNMATHIKATAEAGTKINPLKASKRASKKK